MGKYTLGQKYIFVSKIQFGSNSTEKIFSTNSLENSPDFEVNVEICFPKILGKLNSTIFVEYVKNYLRILWKMWKTDVHKICGNCRVQDYPDFEKNMEI